MLPLLVFACSCSIYMISSGTTLCSGNFDFVVIEHEWIDLLKPICGVEITDIFLYKKHKRRGTRRNRPTCGSYLEYFILESLTKFVFLVTKMLPVVHFGTKCCLSNKHFAPCVKLVSPF